MADLGLRRRFSGACHCSRCCPVPPGAGRSNHARNRGMRRADNKTAQQGKSLLGRFMLLTAL
jgi:hypothetical protein